ncbi:MAG TPA: 50S ribosomal protein L17 [Candidatus Paceibacterota bacterium]
MRKRKRGRKFHRESSQRKAMMSHLTSALFINGKIKTTEAKAKELKPLAEQMITRAKKGTLANRRQLAQTLPNKVVKVLVDEIAPRLSARNGGYTRITKLAARKSDGASQAVIEIM